MINIKKSKLYSPYIILIILYIFFILAAFIIDTPKEIFYGLKNIILSPDILISDYVEIGGIGASLVNSALTSSLCMLLLILSGVKPNGATIMSLWLITGFSFFGKNIFNIWPIIIGVYLYSKYEKEPFLNYSLVALLSTSLAPVVTQLSFVESLPRISSIIIGYLIGIFTGFILTPIVSHCIKAHNGYNLYNIGFAAGLFATLLMSIFRAIGIDFESRVLWNTKSTSTFLVILLIISVYLIFLGLYKNSKAKENYLKLLKKPGRLVTDFYILYGNTCYLNMGILCLLTTIFLLILKADLNGGTIAGIFTIIGFGSFGKHLRNITPVMIGAILAALINVNPINSPSLILSILFSTGLSPIAGKYGYGIGILTGFLHVCMVCNIGSIHGGLNLYNNGLSAGLVAMLLIPIINIFKKEP